MPDVRMLRYKSDIAALRTAVGQQRDGRLRCDPNSVALMQVTCENLGGTRLTCHMFVRDLYILGFAGSGGHQYFFDETQLAKKQAVQAAYQFQTGGIRRNLVAATWTGFGADYGSLGCHGVDKDKVVSANEIDKAIAALAGYAGVSDGTTKFHVACITHYISEALRFREVEGAVAGAIAERNKGTGASFKFGDFQDVVTNWDALSGGSASTNLKANVHVKILAH